MKNLSKKWHRFIDNPPTLTLVKLTAIFLLLVVALATMVNADSYLNLRNLAATSVSTTNTASTTSSTSCITNIDRANAVESLIEKTAQKANYQAELATLTASTQISTSTQSQLNTLNASLTAKKSEMDTYQSQYTSYYNSAQSYLSTANAYLSYRNTLKKPQNPKQAAVYKNYYNTYTNYYNTYYGYYNTYNTYYSTYLTKYNTAKASYDSIKAQIDALTPKVSATTTARIATLNTQITALTADMSLLNTQLKLPTCASSGSTTGGSAGSGTSGGSNTYTPDTGSHALCSDDSDCSNGESCRSSMCVTSGSDVCSTDTDCKEGDQCNAAHCEPKNDGNDVFTNLTCCICTYNDRDGNPSSGSQCDDQLTCSAQFASNNCQITKIVSRSQWFSGAGQITYDTCGDLNGNSYKFFEEGHSCGIDSLTKQCQPMTETIISNWSHTGDIQFSFDNCSGADNLSAAYAVAHSVQQTMIDNNYSGKVVIKAFQNDIYHNSGEPIDFCEQKTGVTYEVCASGIEITYQTCPTVGSSCMIGSGSQDFKCTDTNGSVKNMTCGGSPITQITNTQTGKTEKWGKYINI